MTDAVQRQADEEALREAEAKQAEEGGVPSPLRAPSVSRSRSNP